MQNTVAQRVGSFRWIICALLFFATTINYVDRAVLGILKSDLMRELHWTETDYGKIVSYFSLAYAFGYVGAGRLMDYLGVRVGYGISVFFWSIAAMAHGLARSVFGFSLMRGALGLSEGGNFPGAVKSVSEWFPKRERALATGIFNAGSNVGAILAPLLVPWITLRHGWPWAFYITGGLGFLWLIFWLLIYDAPERHKNLSPEELKYIRSDPPDPQVHIPWLQLLGYRQVWAVIIGMALSAPIWWFYLYWVPGYLEKEHGIDLKNIGPPLIAIYLFADVGSIAGGWLSSQLIKRGWSVNASRKTALLICAICVVPVFAVPLTTNIWVVTFLIGLAAAAHQGFSCNVYTLVSDTAPRNIVSSIVGLAGMSAGLVGMGFAQFTGKVLDKWDNGYVVLFAIAASIYLVNVLVIHLLTPGLEPMAVEMPASPTH
jgi:ACS family hexuronate transporter-like MFS transporter